MLLKRKRTDELVDRKVGAKVVVRANTETPRQLDGDAIGPGKELPHGGASTAGCSSASPADLPSRRPAGRVASRRGAESPAERGDVASRVSRGRGVTAARPRSSASQARS